jgi:hypoxanthine phosphoribosyltransferase
MISLISLKTILNLSTLINSLCSNLSGFYLEFLCHWRWTNHATLYERKENYQDRCFAPNTHYSTVQTNYKFKCNNTNIISHTVKNGDRVVLIDNIIATGGTLNAAISLIEQLGGIVEGIVVLNVVASLKGLDKIKCPKEKIFYLSDVWIYIFI